MTIVYLDKDLKENFPNLELVLSADYKIQSHCTIDERPCLKSGYFHDFSLDMEFLDTIRVIRIFYPYSSSCHGCDRNC